MNKKTRALALVFALVIILAALCGLPTAADSPGEGGRAQSETKVTRRVVSVLYDDSGSMNDLNKTYGYAIYAMQMLMSTLDFNDTLTINTMNSMTSGITVDLSDPNRQKKIEEILTQNYFRPLGSTPSESVNQARAQLIKEGLVDSAHLANADNNEEYWLLILSDGAFEGNKSNTVPVIQDSIKDYPTLKTVYLGLGPAAPTPDELKSLQANYPFTAYHAASTKEIVESMQQVSNQLLGRYTYEKGAFTVNGNVVTLPIDDRLTFRSVSIIAQNCDAVLTSAKYNGKDMKISLPTVIDPQLCSGRWTGGFTYNLGLKKGYTGTVEGDPTLSGGSMVLTFSAPLDPERLSIMAQPALELVSYLEHYKDGNWVAVSPEEITAKLTKGERMRVGYDVYSADRKPGDKPIDVEAIFGSAKVSYTYAGSEINEEFELVVGNHNVETTLNLKDGKYKLFDSIVCMVEDDPTAYYVKGVQDTATLTATDGHRIVYTVYANNQPLGAPALTADYSWTATVTEPDGRETPVACSLGSDGRITVEIKATPRNYGEYKINFRVATKEFNNARTCDHTATYSPTNIQLVAEHSAEPTKGDAAMSFAVLDEGVQLTPEELKKYSFTLEVILPGGRMTQLAYQTDAYGKISTDCDPVIAAYGAYKVTPKVTVAGKVFSAEVAVKYYPHVITVSPLDGGRLSLTQHQLQINGDGALRFEFTADGQPLAVNNGLTELKVTLGGRDITQYVTADGNILSYIPIPDHFGGETPVLNESLKVILSCPEVPALGTEAEGRLEITPTVYEIVALGAKQSGFDKFSLDKLNSVLYYGVKRDGVFLGAEELQSCLDSGALTFKEERNLTGFMKPVKAEISVSASGSEAAIAYRLANKSPVFFGEYGSFHLSGDYPVTASCYGVSLSQTVGVRSNDLTGGASIALCIWSYLWRITLFNLAAWTVMWLITCLLCRFGRACRNFSRQIVVETTVNSDDDEINLCATTFNWTWWERNRWHFRRYIIFRKHMWDRSLPLGKRILNMFWYNCPERKVGTSGNCTCFYEDGEEMLKFSKAYYSGYDTGKGNGDINRFMADLKAFNGSKNNIPYMPRNPDNPLDGEAVKNHFMVVGMRHQTGESAVFSGYYVITDEDEFEEEHADIICFIAPLEG